MTSGNTLVIFSGSFSRFNVLKFPARPAVVKMHKKYPNICAKCHIDFFDFRCYT